MKASIVIRSRDEAPRLRLVLAALEGQEALAEVIVVDDGSLDETPQVVAAARGALPLVALRNATAAGRAAASNLGATAASGELLIFLDGDTLAAPGLIAAHVAKHASGTGIVGRGETWHLRCTRFLADPETASFRPEEADRDAATPPDARDALRVTRAQVRHDFAAIARRARPGIYPGAAPERLHAAEMRALHDHPNGTRLWAAASGSNLSLRRDTFLASGGFDAELTINEHRELAYRLCTRGARMAAVAGARTCHLTHRAGWRDPLADTGWEERFRAKHPEAPLAALRSFWLSLSGGPPAPDFFAAP